MSPALSFCSQSQALFGIGAGRPYVQRRSKIFRGQLKMGISTVETSGKLIETLIRPSADAELFMSRA